MVTIFVYVSWRAEKGIDRVLISIQKSHRFRKIATRCNLPWRLVSAWTTAVYNYDEYSLQLSKQRSKRLIPQPKSQEKSAENAGKSVFNTLVNGPRNHISVGYRKILHEALLGISLPVTVYRVLVVPIKHFRHVCIDFEVHIAIVRVTCGWSKLFVPG